MNDLQSIAVCLVMAMLATGCGGEKKPPALTAPATGTTARTSANTIEITTGGRSPAPAVAEEVKPPQIFSDSSTQRQFEELFEGARSSFNPPTPGMLVRVETTDGAITVGELIRYTANGLVVATPDAPVTFARIDLTPENQAELFLDAFAEQLAKSQIDNQAISGSISTAGQSMLPPRQNEVLELRQMTAERMIPRNGPGRHFAPIPDNILFRGINIAVIDQRKDWICVRENAESAPLLGWIPKHASGIPFTDSNRERVAAEVESLQESGFLVSIDPQINEAFVDTYLWRISDGVTVEGVARLLARYCGQQKNIRVFFVVIKDATTGRKVAEFSESRGFKVF